MKIEYLSLPIEYLFNEVEQKHLNNLYLWQNIINMVYTSRLYGFWNRYCNN